MYKLPIRHKRLLRGAAMLALVLLWLPVAAQPQALPIQVEADNADWSQRSGVSNYNGNVVLTRGGLTLTGGKLTIKRINNRQNVQAELSGSPAHLDKQPDREGDQVVTGHARRIEYSNSDSILTLRGGAVVERAGGDRVTGQVIHYNLDTERTRAESGSGDSDRVRITIQPDNSNGGP